MVTLTARRAYTPLSVLDDFSMAQRTNLRTRSRFVLSCLGPLLPPLILQPSTPLIFNRHSLTELSSLHQWPHELARDIPTCLKSYPIYYLLGSRPCPSTTFIFIQQNTQGSIQLSPTSFPAHSFDKALVSWATPPLIPHTQGLLIRPEICPGKDSAEAIPIHVSLAVMVADLLI